MNGMSTLIKEVERNYLSLPACEDTEKAPSIKKGRVLTSLDLRLSNLQNCEK
jgi:hypothetical protein